MTHLALCWWSKSESRGRGAATTPTIMNGSSLSSSSSVSAGSCCGLSKLVRRGLKLLKRRKMLHYAVAGATTASRQSSFQCRYDPLSYSLNFDKGGGLMDDDDDYYKFYAFSSRFVANATPPPTTNHPAASNSCQQRLLQLADDPTDHASLHPYPTNH